MAVAGKGAPRSGAALRWRAALESVFEGKKVILTGRFISDLIPRARKLRELGAASTFLLATAGMGSINRWSEEDGPYFNIDETAGSGSHEREQVLLGDLPQSARAALDVFDPASEAMVVGGFLMEQPAVAGRRSLAYRKPAWLALEDKTIIDTFWDEIGVVHSPSEVVVAEKEILLGATRRQDQGDGVVWSGDIRDGLNASAALVRWIRPDTDFGQAVEFYRKRCANVRVMPFLEGVPCSIHGMVFADYTAVFRPVEMIILRRPDSSRFLFAGAATYWDPQPADRDMMRTIARRAGDALRDTVGFRGIFGIDGVMTKDGFRPTELNPRYGIGIEPQMTGLPGLPLELVGQAVVAGAISLDPQELEELIVTAADGYRHGNTWNRYNGPATRQNAATRPVRLTESGWQWTDDGDSADGQVFVKSRKSGDRIRLDSNGSSLLQGKPFAPFACQFWQFMGKNLNTGMGGLFASKEVR